MHFGYSQYLNVFCSNELKIRLNIKLLILPEFGQKTMNNINSGYNVQRREVIKLFELIN